MPPGRADTRRKVRNFEAHHDSEFQVAKPGRDLDAVAVAQGRNVSAAALNDDETELQSQEITRVEPARPQQPGATNLEIFVVVPMPHYLKRVDIVKWNLKFDANLMQARARPSSRGRLGRFGVRTTQSIP